MTTDGLSIRRCNTLKLDGLSDDHSCHAGVDCPAKGAVRGATGGCSEVIEGTGGSVV